MKYSDILVHTEGRIGTITLNSPTTANALSRNMIREITSALEDFGENSEVSALIIRANGKHFCSGHNLSEMMNSDRSEYRSIFAKCSRMMKMLHEIPQVVIAQVHGVATAAGCQLVADSDLAVAAETARFGTPGVRIGLFCTTPMVALSRAVGRKHAMELLMTGRLVPAAEAERWGLINRAVPEAELEAAVNELAQGIVQASPLTLGIGKRAFYKQIEFDEPHAYEYGTEVITLNLMSEDAQEGITSFLGKKTPTWKGK
jgi:enoyl-CoA hydratase/carnithine racemase